MIAFHQVHEIFMNPCLCIYWCLYFIYYLYFDYGPVILLLHIFAFVFLYEFQSPFFLSR